MTTRISTLWALVVAVLSVGCGMRYGEMPRSYGDGTAEDPGCWLLRQGHTSWSLDADKARELLPECRTFASEHSKRVALGVTPRATFQRAYGDTRHAIASFEQRLNAWAIVVAEEHWEWGTEREVLRHELLHVMGETHAPGKDFTDAQFARWGYGPGGRDIITCTSTRPGVPEP